MLRRLPGHAGLLCLLLAAGCATSLRQWLDNGLKVGPNYTPPTAPVACDWIDADSPALSPDESDPTAWWTVFGDPLLDALVAEAYCQNLPLKIAAMRVVQARAELGVAVGNLFPQRQSMIGDYSRSQFSENAFPFDEFHLPRSTYDMWDLGFDAAWELDFWGRFRRAVESAQADLGAEVANYDDVLVILEAEVAATYLQMRTFEARLAFARQNVELLEKTLELTRKRLEKGVASELDVQQAESLLAATQAAVPVLENGRRQAQNRLCILLGMPPVELDAELGRSGRIPDVPATVAVGIPADLLRRRPDVRRAERQAAAQSAQLGIAEADFFPQISITGNLRVSAENLDQLFDHRSIAGSVGPGFRWKILNYGRLRSNLRAQEARFRQLVLAYRDVVLRADEDAENAIDRFLREQVRAEYLAKSAAASAAATRLATLQYEKGLVDFQRVIDSQRALVRQQDELAQSRGNVALALVALYKALGGGWPVCPPQIVASDPSDPTDPADPADPAATAELPLDESAPLPPQPPSPETPTPPTAAAGPALESGEDR